MPLAGSRDSVPCGVWGNAPTVPRPTNAKEVANKGAGSEASLPVTLRSRRSAPRAALPLRFREEPNHEQFAMSSEQCNGGGRECLHRSDGNKFSHQKKPLRRIGRKGFLLCNYLAYSIERVSRMTLTRICPGYSISFSMRLAISLARIFVPSSVTSSGLTMMRTSRPD